MNRAARRRAKREGDREREANGVGLGWRWTSSTPRKRYKVREHTRPIDIEQLEAESDAARNRWGITA